MKCGTLALVLGMTLPMTVPATGQPGNTLAPEEIAQGWVLLWDGVTTFGWESAARVDWKTTDGTLSMPAGSYTWLRHKTPLGDFVLKVDFRMMTYEADSGIFIRAAKDGDPSRTGYQVNINNMNEEWATGSLVFRHKADPSIGKVSADTWHTYEITADGDHIMAFLDGRKTVDVRDTASRFGYIGLQFVKGDEIEFRNVKLRPLGLEPLFNGKDLSGWERIDRPNVQAPPEWSVREGAIHVEKGPGQLETASIYSNFVLQLDVRANSTDASRHPNSGVFWRGDRGAFWSGYESQIRNEFKDGDRSQPVDFGTGGIYNRQSARRVVSNDNEFFTKTIVAFGRHMATWVNGLQVTCFEDDRSEGPNARLQARLAPGPISLQAHDPTTNLDFRNIRVAALPEK
ncbi:MAG: DUF1080 domain-containing protein [Acidobacteria bacterium]|nr:DUF1080 domain-containing protein [Acidobacteriota bacterium]